MSEYDILLRPTKIDENWDEMPKITTCGKNKEQVKTWEDVVESAKDLGYTENGNIVFKSIENNGIIGFNKDGRVFINEGHITNLEYNKMVLFMLLLEKKI